MSAEVRKNRVQEKSDQLDARAAATDASIAESYALDAIDFRAGPLWTKPSTQRSMRCTRARRRREAPPKLIIASGL